MVVATGFFDGVHRGHRIVIGALVRAARERGTESVVVTFWPHPRNVLQNDARGLRLLSSFAEKEAMLRELGVDRRNFSQQEKDHTRRILRVEWLTHLVLNYGCSADWLLTGRGWPWGA